MEAAIISEDSGDAEIKSMKDQLMEYGLEEDNLTKEEMSDLLQALNNSKTTAKAEEPINQKIEVEETSKQPTHGSLKRRYKNVRDRRMPWSLFSNTLSNAQKARLLAVYIKLMSINQYRQARLSSSFTSWAPPIQILEETSKVHSLRSTRSGRSVPVYCTDIEEDSSDVDFVVTKPKKRKVSGSENQGSYTNKVFSLKRKFKEDTRYIKDVKILDDRIDVVSTSEDRNIKDTALFLED